MTAPGVSVHLIGATREPIVVVDHFHPDPDALRRAAIGQSFGPAREHYPGLRAALPDDYFAQVGATISTVLHQAFAATARRHLLDASFSIVTRRPEELTLSQRLPHVDSVDRRRFAMVHYLTPEGGDGTAFFRHRATGIECLHEQEVERFYDRLNIELREAGTPRGYVHGSTPLFDQIAKVDARFNRAVFYRSALFHSGAIAPQAVLSADPAVGRLTVTAFLAVDAE